MSDLRDGWYLVRCPLDSSCGDDVRVLVKDGEVLWAPSVHLRGCERPFHGTETWSLDTAKPED